MEIDKQLIEAAQAQNGMLQYQTIVTSATHTITADEPVSMEGGDTGMNPYSLLLASLASCTAITLRMYIIRKMWIVEQVTVNTNLYKAENGTLIERQLSFTGELTDVQKDRLIQIANACPIHKILVGNIEIKTSLN
ncbi:MAG TPA: OsmC family protein [Mucilaginibacter sp.]